MAGTLIEIKDCGILPVVKANGLGDQEIMTPDDLDGTVGDNLLNRPFCESYESKPFFTIPVLGLSFGGSSNLETRPLECKGIRLRCPQGNRRCVNYIG